jgi:hypothetical protein
MAIAFKPAEPGTSKQTDPNGCKKGHSPYFVKYVSKICMYDMNVTCPSLLCIGKI